MMFGMIPFDRRDDNLFDVFDNFEKKFFGNTNASLPAFRTDIRDQGDKFLLEAGGGKTISRSLWGWIAIVSRRDL